MTELEVFSLIISVLEGMGVMGFIRVMLALSIAIAVFNRLTK